jgi:hypothetical protein
VRRRQQVPDSSGATGNPRFHRRWPAGDLPGSGRSAAAATHRVELRRSGRSHPSPVCGVPGHRAIDARAYPSTHAGQPRPPDQDQDRRLRQPPALREALPLRRVAGRRDVGPGPPALPSTAARPVSLDALLADQASLVVNLTVPRPLRHHETALEAGRHVYSEKPMASKPPRRSSSSWPSGGVRLAAPSAFLGEAQQTAGPHRRGGSARSGRLRRRQLGVGSNLAPAGPVPRRRRPRRRGRLS